MSEADILIEASVGGTPYEVQSLSIERALSELGSAQLELKDGEGELDPAELVGQTLSLKMRRADDSSITEYCGLIEQAAHIGGDSTQPFVRIHVVPQLWRLSKRSDCRVFSEMTTEDIVKDVLDRAGISGHDWQLSGSYQPRTYCVQHRETDLDFIARLLSEEGIRYAIEVQDGSELVVFSDADIGPLCGGSSELPYIDEFGFDASRDRVEQLEQLLSVQSDRVTLRDYDFERPDFELKGEHEAAGDGPKTLETYVYPARTQQQTVAKHYATVLLESLQSESNLVMGRSQALHLSPGRRFTISQHPYEPLNGEYRVIAVQHRYRASHWGTGGAQLLGCDFIAMPVSAGTFRPPRKERAQRIAGYDSAVVVGPSGAEIHPDNFGRVKAQHMWDREGDATDKASCWMRATQLPLGGGLLNPRVGWEVSVQYREGDPDQPMVTGRMYTAKAPPPYALPANKTRSVIQTATSPGGEGVNELRFDDKLGSEEMFMNASKDMSMSAGNNATETVGGNEVRTIGGNQDIDVTGAKSAVSASQAWSISGSQSVGVSTYMVDDNGGAHSLSIGGSRDLTIGGDHRALVGASSSLNVGGIQVDLVAGSVTDATPSPMTETIGAALVELAAGGHNVVCASRVEDVGAVKAVLASGSRGVQIGGTLTHDVAAAIAISTKAHLQDNSAGKLTDVAGGAQVIKAVNVTFTAKSLLTVVCGGSTLTLTPGSVSLLGATIKLNGVTPQTAAMIKDN